MACEHKRRNGVPKTQLKLRVKHLPGGHPKKSFDALKNFWDADFAGEIIMGSVEKRFAFFSILFYWTYECPPFSLVVVVNSFIGWWKIIRLWNTDFWFFFFFCFLWHSFQIRRREELLPIVIDRNVHAGYAEYRRLSPAVRVYPGDRLIAECTYNSSQRTAITLGGSTTREETCKAFAVYYPKQKKLTACHSLPSLPTVLHSLGIGELAM